MNLLYAREIGLRRYFWRTLLYKLQTRLLQRDVEKILPTGVPMSLPRDRDHSAEIYGTDCRVDWGAETLLAEYLETRGARSERDFIDVGANIGFYSMLMSPKVRMVHAFEPDPRNLGPLRMNAARVPNVQVVESAAANTIGTRYFDVAGAHEVNHLSSAVTPTENLLAVDSITLDAYSATLPAGVFVAAIKMDVEGSECEVLEGAHELTRRDQPVFLIEFMIGGTATNTVERLSAFLQRHDYGIYSIVRDASFVKTRRASLRKLEAGEIFAFRTKMLFLVPRSERFFSAGQTIFAG
jgi:FkbM family methyltransferase